MMDGISVAPRRGAWVETTVTLHLVWSQKVAPRRGAWVETSAVLPNPKRKEVAPRRGAWVETMWIMWDEEIVGVSHPAGVRGLKRWSRC